jgi:hypothetical protein
MKIQVAEQRNIIKRKKYQRQEFKTALLVCEGKCTEPFYLNGLLNSLGINPARVEIIKGQSKSNSVAVFNRARKRFNEYRRDLVFIVIDAEQTDLHRAIELCKTPLQNANKRNRIQKICIEPIISAPCFEFWLVLHFRYCDKPFLQFSDVILELQIHLPNYSKTDKNIFNHVGGEQGLQLAMSHIGQLKKSLTEIKTKNPYTDMDKLVEALRTIAMPS